MKVGENGTGGEGEKNAGLLPLTPYPVLPLYLFAGASSSSVLSGWDCA